MRSVRANTDVKMTLNVTQLHRSPKLVWRDGVLTLELDIMSVRPVRKVRAKP